MKKSFLMLATSFVFGTGVQAQTQNWEWTLKPQFDMDYIGSDILIIAWPTHQIGELITVSKHIDTIMNGQHTQYSQISLVNKMGKLISSTPFEDIGYYSDDLISAKQNGKVGFIDNTGKWIIQPQFEWANDFLGGLADVVQNGKWGFIDKTGKWIIQPQFESAQAFASDLAAAKQNDKWGFIDKTGQWVIQPQFEDVKYRPIWSLYTAKQNDKWGLIDKTGKWVIQPQFDDILGFSKAKDIAAAEIKRVNG
jgi:WG containing repeat